MGQETQQKAGLNATQKILIAGFAVIIVVAIVLGVLILTKENPQPASNNEVFPDSGGTIVLDEDNVEDAIAELREKAAKGMFDAKMSTTWNFPDGTAPSGDAYVANPQTNHGPIAFELKLGDTEEVIYTSPKIPLGSAVKDIKLTKDLEAGTYECVCAYKLYDEDESPLNEVNIAVTINVAA